MKALIWLAHFDIWLPGNLVCKFFCSLCVCNVIIPVSAVKAE